jgi:hypothetical protein
VGGGGLVEHGDPPAQHAQRIAVALVVGALRRAQPDLHRLRVLSALRVGLAELLERAAMVGIRVDHAPQVRDRLVPLAITQVDARLREQRLPVGRGLGLRLAHVFEQQLFAVRRDHRGFGARERLARHARERRARSDLEVAAEIDRDLRRALGVGELVAEHARIAVLEQAAPVQLVVAGRREFVLTRRVVEQIADVGEALQDVARAALVAAAAVELGEPAQHALVLVGLLPALE